MGRGGGREELSHRNCDVQVRTHTHSHVCSELLCSVLAKLTPDCAAGGAAAQRRSRYLGTGLSEIRPPRP